MLSLVVSVSVIGAASTARAGAPDGKLRLDAHAELLAPNVVGLTVSYKCAESVGTVGIWLYAFQPATQARARSGDLGGDLPQVLCTGRWQTVDWPVANPEPNPPAFQPGAALAGASLFIGDESVGLERHIRIAG